MQNKKAKELTLELGQGCNKSKLTCNRRKSRD